MAADVQKLRPGELCRLLNSTPLGAVIDETKLRRHRTKAGMHIGDGRHVDLLRYVAWLVQVRHVAPQGSAKKAREQLDVAEAAQAAAAIASRSALKKGPGRNLSVKQEKLIAALLTEPTQLAAAAKANISEATMYRWLNQSEFRAALQQAGREVVEHSITRLQAATGQGVNALIEVTAQGRDSVRVRAAHCLLSHASRGITDIGLPQHRQELQDAAPLGTSGLVEMLNAQLRQINQSNLPAAEKSKLTARLSDPYLKALIVDSLEKRLATLESRTSEGVTGQATGNVA